MSKSLIFDPSTGELISSARELQTGDKATDAAAPAPVPRVPEGIDDRIFDALSRGPAARRMEALHSIASNPTLDWSARTMAAMTALVADPDPALVARTLEVSALVGFRAAVTPVVSAILRDAAPGAKIAALNLAAGYGAQGTVLADAVMPLLESAAPEVAGAALNALAAIGLTPSSVALLSSLVRHRETRVRLLCVRLLGLLGARASMVSGLVILRLDDPEQAVRTEAAEALRRIGFHQSALEETGRMLAHGRKERRIDMLRVLARFGSSAQDASPLVVPLLKLDDPDFCEEARRTLKNIGLCRECVRSIAHLSTHPSHAVRSAAMDLLEECGSSPESCTLAVSLMADRDTELRARAARVIARYGVPAPTLPAMRKLLRDERSDVRMLALSSLSSAGRASAPAARLILERMEDADADVARAAAAAFAATGAVAETTADISRILHNRRQDRRLLMLSTLRGMGQDAAAALPLVTASMGDPDWLVRDGACEAFISIGFNDSCLPEVRRLIEHQDRNYRLAVVKALGACGMNAAAASDFLSKRSGDADAEVGRAARLALEAVTGRRQD
ncbi:MAG TPA: HEAT repeat domain-containing protein [Opitutales bacterium]|nr:HEAT repeat domain-containing protein [Opitutales bacterium]